jgi:hypothetical protein
VFVVDDISVRESLESLTSEPRRYFPEWTHCALGCGREVEADHNSYLAGGYAEEFGYVATAEWSRGVPVLEEAPDRFRKRRGQAQMTHPGYPLRAYPLARGVHRSTAAKQLRVRTRAERVDSQRTDTLELVDHGNYLIVGTRRNDGKHGGALEQAVKRATIHLTSSIISMRWALRHRKNFYMRRLFSAR